MICSICQKPFRGGFTITMRVTRGEEEVGYIEERFCSKACGIQFAEKTHGLLSRIMMLGGRGIGDAA